MAVYYYQGNQILAPLTIESNQPVFASDTVSLKHIRTAQNSQRWEISFNVLTNDNAADTLINMLGELSVVSTMIMPQLKEVSDRSTATGTLSLDTNAAAGDTTISLSAIGGVGLLPKGSFIKFSNHSKVYLLKTDVNLDTTGPYNASIYPSLRVPVTSGTTQVLYGNSCLLSYYRDLSTMNGIKYSDGILVDVGQISLIEAL
jgi:hypothetical protein